MTKDQAYRAMFAFLDERYSRLPSDALGQLLGEMALLEDGLPADPAIAEEWNAAVKTALLDQKRL
jgi:hypothetical protein